MVSLHRVRLILGQLLHTHDTPSRTAFAYALGVFFGFSPVLGLHTILGLACAFALKLNRVAVLLGVYSNLPWILVPYYTLATWLGAALLGLELPHDVVERLISSLENQSWADFLGVAGTLRPLFWAFVLGSTVGALLLSFIAYRVSFVMITTHRRQIRRPQNTEL